MKHAKTILSRLKSMSFPLFAMLVSIYFSAHGFKSVTTQKLLNEEIAALEQKHTEIKAIKEDLELHVGLLSSDHVDPDYLDELARKELGFSHRDEIIIPSN